MKKLMYAPLLLSCLFTLLIGLITLPGVDDAHLQAFVLHQGECELPCWQGIQPGKSDVFAALRILQTHPWVSEIYPSGANISWGWSGEQPAYINPAGRGMIATDWDRVTSIIIPTQVMFGEILLAFDQPAWHTYTALRGTSLLTHTSVYPGFSLYSVLSCPVAQRRMWEQPVALMMEVRTTSPDALADDLAPLWRREMSVCNG